MSEIALPRVITEPLGGSPLSLLAQRGEAPAGWYEPLPRSRADWTTRVRAVAAEGLGSRNLGALAGALHASGAAGARVARVIREGGVVVTTGQQPGLFGGPVYTWSKALAALALADALERATGVPAAPIFWAATDDADALEASETVVAVVGGAERLVSTIDVPAGTPMCAAPLGDVSPLFERLAASAGSATHHEVLDAARAAYRKDTTVGGAYVALLEAVLNPLGVAVLDAGHARVRELASPIGEAAIRRAESIAGALARRAEEIRAAGLEPQVEEADRLSLVFEWKDEVKTRVPIGSAAPRVAGSLSPNVLLRPVVERALLPTVGYVAGPGELAYFAQVGPVADALEAARPLAVPRWSCTILEPRVERALERLDLTLDDVRDATSAERILAERALPAEARAVIELARSQAAVLGDRLAALAGSTGPIDERVATGHARRAEWQAARLERRILAGVKRREEEAMRMLGTIRGSLWPLGSRQERTLNLLPLLARYGPSLLERMREGAGAWASKLVER